MVFCSALEKGGLHYARSTALLASNSAAKG
jgi:hypothetical protein